MSASRSVGSLVSMLAVLGGAPAGVWAQQSVHPFAISALVLDDEIVGGESQIFKAKATSDDFVQLARGRSLDEKPPGNEILAAIVDCGTSATPYVTRIVVWDTDQDMVLAEVSDPIQPDDAVFQSKGGPMNIVAAQFIADVSLNETGDEGVNAIDGGEWKVAGQAKIDKKSADACPKKVKLTFLGTLDFTFTDDVGTTEAEAIVTKAKGTANSAIAFVPAP